MSNPRSCHYRPADLLAHRAPMLLLDEILHYDTNLLRAAIDVRPGRPFCDEQGAPGWVGLEWLAQAAGAWVGARQLDSGDKVRIGFLLGTRRYTGPEKFKPGRIIAETSVVLFDPASGMAVLDGTLLASNASADHGTLASARIKLYQPPDVAKFLDEQKIQT